MSGGNSGGGAVSYGENDAAAGKPGGGIVDKKTGALVLLGPTLPELSREGVLKGSTRAKFYREYQRCCEEVDAFAGTAGGAVYKASLKICIEVEAPLCAFLAYSLGKDDKTACAELSDFTDDTLISWLCPKEKEAKLVSANELIDSVKRLNW